MRQNKLFTIKVDKLRDVKKLCVSIRAFRHTTKSSPAAGRTRRRLGNTSTCPYVRFDI